MRFTYYCWWGSPLEEIFLSELELEENMENVDLIKFDIEGSEYNVIENSKLLKHIKYIIIEFHPFGMKEQEVIKNLPQPGQFGRAEYLKKFTDSFIKKHLPNHKIIVGDEVQYLLELQV